MRLHDADYANRIANIPEVARGLLPGGDENDWDFTVAVSKPENIFLRCGEGVALCEWSAPRVYECHLLFPPSCRGRRAINEAREMSDFMMANHADVLWGRPPRANRAAIWMIRQVGFHHAGFGHHTLVGDVEYLVRDKLCHHL